MRKVPLILQLSDTECGIASLAMIFAYYKLNVSLEELRDQCGVTRDGCKAKTLIAVAERYGFKAEAFSVSFETIKFLRAPVIAHWNFTHYVVLKCIRKNQAFINDPALGAIVVSAEEFIRSFTGIIINIEPTSATLNNKINHVSGWLGKIHSAQPTQKRLFKPILFIAICLLSTAISEYFNLAIYKLIIDQITKIILISVLLYLVSLTTSYLYKTLSYKLINKQSFITSANEIRHIFELPMLFFALRQRSEIYLIAAKIEAVTNGVLKNTFQISTGIMLAFICVICMALLDLRLTIIILLFTLFFTMFILINKQQIKLNEQTYHHAASSLQSYTLTCFNNIESIKVGALNEIITNKWLMYFSKATQIQHIIDIKNAFIFSIIKSYTPLCVFLILLNASCSPTNLVVFYALTLIFHSHITNIINALPELLNCQLYNKRINDIKNYKKDLRYLNSDTILQLQENSNIIDCQNVTFYYNTHSNPNLLNINLRIKPGQHIAFIGETGSGKSTLAKLLCALHQPTHGQILMMGNNITNFSANDLAKTVAYVSQDISLFAGSILDNLTFGKDISLDEVNIAIRITCLEKLIAEKGLNAIVEEGGINLSGGEKQRIEIARAILQNTPLLILDEATSALDTQTEFELIHNLRLLNKTIIFVAHRLSSISHCDQIFEFKNGQIIKYDYQTIQK